MRTLVRDIEVDDPDDPIYLAYMTDTHIGAKACAEKLIEEDIRTIQKHPNFYLIHGGDSIDCIARKGDKRFNEETISPWLYGENDIIGAQLDRFVEIFRSVSHKILAMVEGNHERAAVKYYDRDPYKRYTRQLAMFGEQEAYDIQLGYQGFIVIRLKKDGKTLMQVPIYLNHGYGGGRLAGGHALTMERVLGDYGGIALALMGHRHTRTYVEKYIPFPNLRSGGVDYEHRQGLFGYSYLRSYIRPGNYKSSARPVDTYAEQFGLPPKPVGGNLIRFDIPEKKITIELANKPGFNHMIREQEEENIEPP